MIPKVVLSEMIMNNTKYRNELENRYKKGIGKRTFDYIDYWNERKPLKKCLIAIEGKTGMKGMIGKVGNDEIYTWEMIEKETKSYGGKLMEMGIKKGDRICTMIPYIKEHIFLMFAVHRIGGILVPLDLRYEKEELMNVFELIKPKMFVFSGKIVKGSNQFDLKEMVKVVMNKYHVKYGGECEYWIQIDCVDDNKEEKIEIIENAISLKEFKSGLKAAYLKNKMKELVGKGVAKMEREVMKNDPCFIIFTAGSTGKPKAAILSHDNVIAQSLAVLYAFIYPTGAGERYILVNHPPCYIGGLTEQLFPAIVAGEISCVLSIFDAEKSLEAIEKYKIDFITQFPIYYERQWNLPNYKRYNISSIGCTCYCGHTELDEFLSNIKKMSRYVVTGYSCTEIAGFGTFTSGRGSVDDILEGVGYDNPLCVISIRKRMDDNGFAGDKVPMGEIGEICFQGPQVFCGYYGNNELTSKVLSKDGILYTGDIGSYDKKGLHFAARKKLVIQTKGYIVFPEEVEDIIFNAFPDEIENCAVVGADHKNYGQGIVALIEWIDKEVEYTTKDVINRFNDVSLYKTPLLIIFIEQIPLNRIKQVDYLECQKIAAREIAKETNKWLESEEISSRKVTMLKMDEIDYEFHSKLDQLRGDPLKERTKMLKEIKNLEKARRKEKSKEQNALRKEEINRRKNRLKETKMNIEMEAKRKKERIVIMEKNSKLEEERRKVLSKEREMFRKEKEERRKKGSQEVFKYNKERDNRLKKRFSEGRIKTEFVRYDDKSVEKKESEREMRKKELELQKIEEDLRRQEKSLVIDEKRNSSALRNYSSNNNSEEVFCRYKNLIVNPVSTRILRKDSLLRIKIGEEKRRKEKTGSIQRKKQEEMFRRKEKEKEIEENQGEELKRREEKTKMVEMNREFEIKRRYDKVIVLKEEFIRHKDIKNVLKPSEREERLVKCQKWKNEDIQLRRESSLKNIKEKEEDKKRRNVRAIKIKETKSSLSLRTTKDVNNSNISLDTRQMRDKITSTNTKAENERRNKKKQELARLQREEAQRRDKINQFYSQNQKNEDERRMNKVKNIKVLQEEDKKRRIKRENMIMNLRKEEYRNTEEDVINTEEVERRKKKMQICEKDRKDDEFRRNEKLKEIMKNNAEESLRRAAIRNQKLQNERDEKRRRLEKEKLIKQNLKEEKQRRKAREKKAEEEYKEEKLRRKNKLQECNKNLREERLRRHEKEMEMREKQKIEDDRRKKLNDKEDDKTRFRVIADGGTLAEQKDERRKHFFMIEERSAEYRAKEKRQRPRVIMLVVLTLKLSKLSLIRFTLSIMFFKFGFEIMNSALSMLILERLGLATVVALVTIVLNSTKMFSAVISRILLRRIKANIILGIINILFALSIVIIFIVEGLTNDDGFFGKTRGWVGLPYFALIVHSIFGGIVEVLKKYIPPLILEVKTEDDLRFMEKNNSVFHIWYEIGGIIGAFSAFVLIKYFGTIFSFLPAPIAFAVSAIIVFFLPLKKETATVEETSNENIQSFTINQECISQTINTFFSEFWDVIKKNGWVFPCYVLPHAVHRVIEYMIIPIFCFGIMKEVDYIGILIGGSNIGELIGGIITLILSYTKGMLIKTTILTSIGAALLNLLWIYSINFTGLNNNQTGERFTALGLTFIMIIISLFYSCGDIGFLSRMQILPTETYRKTMSFVYITYFFFVLLLALPIGIISDIYLMKNDGEEGTIIHNTHFMSIIVIISICSVIIFLFSYLAFLWKGFNKFEKYTNDDWVLK